MREDCYPAVKKVRSLQLLRNVGKTAKLTHPNGTPLMAVQETRAKILPQATGLFMAKYPEKIREERFGARKELFSW